MKGGDTATKGIRCNTLYQSVGAPSDSDHLSHHSKRSKVSPSVPSPALTIVSLPDTLLVEIFCRLPRESAGRCKCVSKRWFTLIQDPYLCLSRQEEGFMYLTLNGDYKPHGIEYFVMSNHSAKFKTRRLRMEFLPGFQSSIRDRFEILGTHDDLFLCCIGFYQSCNYYICNLNTKQCVSVPQNPAHADVWHERGGFICEAYYKYSSEDGNGPEYQRGRSNMVQLNSDYRCKVVLISKFIGSSFEFKVEIFSSETGKWAESLVSCPRRVSYNHMTKQGIAYNGMLYWLASGGFLIGLDIFNIDMTASATRSVNVIDQKYCRFVELDETDFEGTKCLGVCQGRLRMCSLLASNEPGQVLAVWELKEEEDNRKWCSVHKILFNQMDLDISLSSHFWGNRITPVAVHPNNEDVLCLDLNRNLVMCKTRTRELKVVRKNGSTQAFQVLLPWLPTSIPKLEGYTLTRKKRKLKKKTK